MPETPDADRLAAMSDAELIQAAVNSQRDAWTSVHVSQIEQRLAELERKVNHADLPAEVIAWFASIAERGAITGQFDINVGRHGYGPVIQYAIYPDGKFWLQLCDMNMACIWRLM